MSDIMMVLAGLGHGLNATTMRRLAAIVEAMLSISRWSELGGSYRTIQHFVNTSIACSKVHRLIVHGRN